jgi:hypothetical protein
MLMPTIWVVGEPHHPSIAQYGEVVAVPPVIIDTKVGAGYLMRKRYDRHTAIRQAMSNALHFAKVGDLIMQNDVELIGDPFTGDVAPHYIRTLAKGRPGHYCPQAFIVYDTETRDEILDLWANSRHQACVAWARLWFVDDLIVAEHRGQPHG